MWDWAAVHRPPSSLSGSGRRASQAVRFRIVLRSVYGHASVGAMGATHWRVLTREILPNIIIPMLIYALLVAARIIVIEGVLSFLGLSVPPPRPTWGNMIADGQTDLATLPYIAFIPSALMFLTVLSIYLIGERLRAQSDVRGSAL